MCFNYFETNNTDTPALIQMDVIPKEPKMGLMKKNNMSFVEESGICNFHTVKKLK